MTDFYSNQSRAHDRVLTALQALSQGKMVILTDDETRENEGDLVFPAEDSTPEKINFLAKEARGLICLSLAAEKIDELQLPMMKSKKNNPLGTAFTVSIEAKEGVTTGISAADRSHTIQVVMAENCSPDDIVVPGHIFPLRAKAGGVLERVGHTEGSVDLMRLAGKKPGAVICEIMNEDGTMARKPDLEVFAKRHALPLLSIQDLITYRLLHDTLVKELHRGPFQTPLGTFEGIEFKNTLDNSRHLALINGDNFESQTTHVRVQRQNHIRDSLGYFAPSRDHLFGHDLINYSLEMLAKKKPSVFLYLSNSSSAQDSSSDEIVTTMDPRQIGIGAQILKKIGVRSMHLYVTSPKTLVALGGFGLQVSGTTVIQPG